LAPIFGETTIQSKLLYHNSLQIGALLSTSTKASWPACTAASTSSTDRQIKALSMEQRTLKNVNNCLNTNIYSYLETSGGISSNPHLNIAPFLTPVLIRHLWQLNTVAFRIGA